MFTHPDREPFPSPSVILIVAADKRTAAGGNNIGHLTVWSVLTVQVNCR